MGIEPEVFVGDESQYACSIVRKATENGKIAIVRRRFHCVVNQIRVAARADANDIIEKTFSTTDSSEITREKMFCEGTRDFIRKLVRF